MSEDNRTELGRLIREELEASGMGPESGAKLLPAELRRSFYSWLAGTNVPRNKNRALLEEVFGWEPGSVKRILEAPITERLTLGDVSRKLWGDEAPVAAKAAELSTDELLIELTRRVGVLQAQVDASHSGVLARSDMGLAASDDHVPGEDDRD